MTMMTTTESTINPKHEMKHGDDTEQNCMMLEPHVNSSIVTTTAMLQRFQAVYQIQNNAQYKSVSTWAHGLPQILAQGKDHSGSDSGMACNLFDDNDYLRFLNLLIERS